MRVLSTTLLFRLGCAIGRQVLWEGNCFPRCDLYSCREWNLIQPSSWSDSSRFVWNVGLCNIYQTTRRYIQEYCHLYSHWCWILKSHQLLLRSIAVQPIMLCLSLLLERRWCKIVAVCISIKSQLIFFFSCATAPRGLGSAQHRGFTITLRHITIFRIPLDEWSDRRRDLYLTTHNTHKGQADFIAPRWIRTHNPSKGADTDRRLRPRSHCDRPPSYVNYCYIDTRQQGMNKKAVILTNMDYQNLIPGRGTFVKRLRFVYLLIFQKEQEISEVESVPFLERKGREAWYSWVR